MANPCRNRVTTRHFPSQPPTSHERTVMMRRLLSLCAVAALAGAIDPPRFPHQPSGNGTKLLTYNITTGSPGALSVSTTSVTWVNSEHDGDFITEGEDGSLLFENVVSGNK